MAIDNESWFCCPTSNLLVGGTDENECSPCFVTALSNCDNYQAYPSIEDEYLPIDAIQCPIRYPFSKHQEGFLEPSLVIESCCKCQDLTNCEPANEGVNYYNIGGTAAMFEENETIDESKL